MQVFSREFCQISKNTFFTEDLWVTATAHGYFLRQICAIYSIFPYFDNFSISW